MTQAEKQALCRAGLQVDEALERLMGSEDLLRRLLTRFLSDPSYPSLVRALSDGEQTAAFRFAHTLKGVCGNLSMTELGGLVSQQVEFLRSAGGLEDARELMPAIEAAYSRLCVAIQDYVA